MFDTKGVSGVVMALIVLFAVVISTGLAVGMQQLTVKKKAPKVTYDGAFAAVQPIQEVTGYNDLTVTKQTLNNSVNTVSDSKVVSSFNVNESDGNTIRYVVGLDISGPMEEIDVESTENIVASAFDVKSVKLVRDQDDEKSLSDLGIVVKEFTVDSDDEVDGTVHNLDEGGDYALVTELRGTDTAQVTTDADLYTFDLDATTDADSDEAEEAHVTIDNA